MPVGHVKALTDAPAAPQHDPSELAPVLLGKFTFRPTGLTVEGDPSFDEWRDAMQVLAVMERGLAFVIGDMIRFGERKYGELAAQVIDARSWSPETVRNYTWISEKVPLENRYVDKGLSVAHHQAVAALPAPQQRKWLREALSEPVPWTVSRLRAALRVGADVTPKSWCVVIYCETEGGRDHLMAELQAKGHQCRAAEKRS